MGFWCPKALQKFLDSLVVVTSFSAFLHSDPDPDHSVEVHSPDQEVVIALGSNTAPAYVTDQPQFVNSAVRAVTKLPPHELLGVLKTIERNMGRTGGIRYGPRPIDLDILFYGKYRIGSDILTVPHERIWERPFVMAPLMDLLGMKRVLPIRNHLWDWSEKTSVMGVLNLTPDSFSDGGKFVSVETAVSRVHSMISEGADSRYGAQSTRPMASRISVEEELDRLIPVLEAVLGMPDMEGKLVSVDTFYSDVATEAVNKGAHIINDVSAGLLDTNMHKMAASLSSLYHDAHEGRPYNDANRCKLSGVPAWRIILDPGIGFSKNTEHNLDILTGLPVIRSEIAMQSLAASHAPLLIGPSRKRFLGEICDRPGCSRRDLQPLLVSQLGF
ncbi:Folate synthesis bifunctional protein [Hibiscus syriacus]|uniref:2-amino-4-hydroxy-6-hydroxymethyldihydropteridine diphosphokinase n=1 Tax=Hibiscus syriacus TaxID=106335 RepID=A0A6A3BMP0_HIBSY|nr:Folate synthesis bifunctional protein [Hibiscus syriacus]